MDFRRIYSAFNRLRIKGRVRLFLEGMIKLKQGMLVFLNGTSSSGKTSISTELIHQKEIPFYHLSIDDFFNNYNDFINNKFPDDPPREIDHKKRANKRR